MCCTDLFGGFLVTPFLTQKGETVSGRAGPSFHSLLHQPHGSPRLTADPIFIIESSLALSLWVDFIVGSQEPLTPAFYTSIHILIIPEDLPLCLQACSQCATRKRLTVCIPILLRAPGHLCVLSGSTDRRRVGHSGTLGFSAFI